MYFRGTPHKIKSFGLSCSNVSFRAHPLSLVKDKMNKRSTVKMKLVENITKWSKMPHT